MSSEMDELKKQPTKLRLRLVSSVSLVLLAIIIEPIYDQYSNHMHVIKPPASFEHWRSTTDFIPAQIGMTYYEQGKLHEVLKGWHIKKGEPGFHVYRLKDNDDIKMDMSFFDDKSVRVFDVKDQDNCTALTGTVLRNDNNCVDRYKVRISNGKDILDGTERNAYGSFAAFSQKTMDYLTNDVVEYPGTIDPSMVENAFISNLHQSTITAQLHNNPMSMSMAIQYIGKKTWLCFSAEDMTDRDGWATVPAPAAGFPSRAPQKDKMKYYMYTSQPGDIFFFPPSWSHTVLTHAGPNVMVNFRQIFLKQFFFQPFLTLHAWLNNCYLKPSNHEKLAEGSVKKEQLNHAEKSLTNEFTRSFHKPFREDHEDNVENILNKIMIEHLCKFEDHHEC